MCRPHGDFTHDKTGGKPGDAVQRSGRSSVQEGVRTWTRRVGQHHSVTKKQQRQTNNESQDLAETDISLSNGAADDQSPEQRNGDDTGAGDSSPCRC